jgi:hypothetical protein
MSLTAVSPQGVFNRDQRVRYCIPPKKIVWAGQGGGNIEGLENLLADDLHVCTVTPSADTSVVLDFGAEYNGGIEIYLVNDHPADMLKARIRFGESVSEVMNEPNNDHSMHDFTAQMSVMARHEFGSTGLRFVRIDFLECNVPVRIGSIKLIALERPYEYRGSFESSDPLLNEIWKIGARTVHLCCQDYILDGIKRDRLLWAGDLHPQINVIANVFGDVDIVGSTLDRIRDMTAADQWMNGYSTYSLWWIVCVYDWYMYTGDKKWLESQCGYISELVKNVLGFIEPSGRENLPENRFIDWVIGHDKTALKPGLHAVTIIALKRAMLIFDIFGCDELSAKTANALEAMRGFDAGKSDFKQVNAMNVLADLADAREVNEKSLALEPARKISAWYAYYVLQVRAMAGDVGGALDMIRQFWGGMLSLGATSFWEHFNTDWLENASRIDELPSDDKVDVHKDCGEYCFVGLRHSLCHGWSGGPAAWLSQYVLGVRPLEPGFEKVIIAPQLGDLEFVSGKVPTPHGDITVEAKKNAQGKTQYTYQLPHGVSKK